MTAPAGGARPEVDPRDPVALTQALVRCPSVTPEEGGALTLLEAVLAPAGFRCVRMDRGGVSNLFAKRGEGPTLAFGGHTDVVPVGDEAAWTHDPFGGEIADGRLWGRGSVDMKSGVAAFVSAALAAPAEGPALALLITGDEEGPALDGTRALLDGMAAAGERVDACIVGEPTSLETLGDQIKVGRRGSMSAWITARGRQGHTAYPARARNPLPPLVRLLDRLASAALDTGSEHFEPSTLALTTVDVGNPATNVSPASARATLNIRYNDAHSADALETWIRQEALAAAEAGSVSIDVTVKRSGDAFLTPPGPLTELAAAAIAVENGRTPRLSTGGGTSDARFIKDVCPVIEVGLVGHGMHQVDESADVADIRGLSRIYGRMIERFGAGV